LGEALARSYKSVVSFFARAHPLPSPRY